MELNSSSAHDKCSGSMFNVCCQPQLNSSLCARVDWLRSISTSVRDTVVKLVCICLSTNRKISTSLVFHASPTCNFALSHTVPPFIHFCPRFHTSCFSATDRPISGFCHHRPATAHRRQNSTCKDQLFIQSRASTYNCSNQ